MQISISSKAIPTILKHKIKEVVYYLIDLFDCQDVTFSQLLPIMLQFQV